MAANRGDDRYVWQLGADGEEVVLRYARDELDWAQGRPLEIFIPLEGERSVRRWWVVRCAPGLPNPDYPEVDCAPTEDRTYPAVYITIERLIGRHQGGIWIVTRVEPTEIRQLVPASELEVRRFVTEFLEGRVHGSGAEEFLSAEGRSRFGDGGRLGPLYRRPDGVPYTGYEVAFVDRPSWPFADLEVGVRLFLGPGRAPDEETLFVGPGTDLSGGRRPLVILGGRTGLIGP